MSMPVRIVAILIVCSSVAACLWAVVRLREQAKRSQAEWDRRDRLFNGDEAESIRSIQSATPAQMDRLLSDALSAPSPVDLDPDYHGDRLMVAERPDRFEQE